MDDEVIEPGAVFAAQDTMKPAEDTPVCPHRVTLVTDHVRLVEIVRCVLCGQRVEITFAELEMVPSSEFEIIRRRVFGAFGVRWSHPYDQPRVR